MRAIGGTHLRAAVGTYSSAIGGAPRAPAAVKSLNEQFYEYVDCVYECFDECPERPDALFRAYTFLSNALDISLSTVDVLVWGIKNNGGTYSAHEVAMKVSISEWEVHRAVNELSRL